MLGKKVFVWFSVTNSYKNLFHCVNNCILPECNYFYWCICTVQTNITNGLFVYAEYIFVSAVFALLNKCLRVKFMATCTSAYIRFLTRVPSSSPSVSETEDFVFLNVLTKLEACITHSVTI